ncbi:MAG: preprotein translocase subunit YajC [Bacteroidetes bacterium]|nr:preprotein translocase subunit YajC [Bacteroidota bacterium]
MKRAKEQQGFPNNTEVGDTIVTTAGFMAKIVRINDDGTLSVELDRNTVVKMDKSAISLEMTSHREKQSADTSCLICLIRMFLLKLVRQNFPAHWLSSVIWVFSLPSMICPLYKQKKELNEM